MRWNTKKEQVFVQSISVDLTDETQEDFGQVFGILTSAADRRVGDALIAHIEDSLVRGLDESAGRAERGITIDAVFESVVGRVNRTLARLSDENFLPFDRHNTRSALVMQKEADVMIATWGDPQVLLFHVSEKRPAGRIFDLMSESQPDRSVPCRHDAGNRGYSNIIAGTVGEKDRLLLSTHNLGEWLSQESLQSIVMEGTPEMASEKLRDNLSHVSPGTSIALLLVDAMKPERKNLSATQHSMNTLLDTASKTNEILSPHLMFGIAKAAGTTTIKGLKIAKTALGESVRLAREAAESARENMAREAERIREGHAAPKEDMQAIPMEDMDEILEEDEELADISVQDVGEGNKSSETDKTGKREGRSRAFVGEAKGPSKGHGLRGNEGPDTDEEEELDESPTRTDESDEKFHAPESSDKSGGKSDKPGWVPEYFRIRMPSFNIRFRGRMSGFIGDIIHEFNDLVPKRRILLMLSLALILFLNHSVAYANWRRAGTEAAAAHERKIATIEQKIDSAEASIIYRDEDRAHTLLEEASVLVADLPARGRKNKEENGRLTALISDKYDALRHAVRLGAPEIVSAISTTGGDPALDSLVVRKGTAWSVSRNGQVFRISLQDGLTEQAGTLPDNSAPAIFVGVANGLVAGGSDGALRRFSYTTGAGTDMTVDFGGNEVAVDDAEVYGPRLYILDSSHNRILKHGSTTSGFTAPQFYLNDGTDISGAVSMAIDGSIYVLMRDGSVVQMLRGARQEFSVQKTDPPVSVPSKIRTSQESDYIYVLDNSEPGRIIQFNKKTGALVAQYHSGELDGATDFHVDETDDVIYVSSGNTILKFTIPEE